MILPHREINPVIPDSCFVARSADIIGDVVLGEESSVWFQVVIRGDVNTIRIGARTNIQDGAILHVTRDKKPMKGAPLVIGDDVTIGHRVTLHGCTLKNRILVGMGATILDGAVIEDDSIVAAGALVTKDKVFPPRSLIQGAPAKVVRELTGEEVAMLKASAANYVGDTKIYNEEFGHLFADHDHEGGCGDEDCGDCH
ncbi:gamma carbonic anhydrase family protein [bacterium]|jgi:carbonic anhydrase/acetyltransferase-like protein (isoleucine patch superfamily)|nr:gamma carbonic anhydrase family protein [bacterium]